ncbi:HAMP domain-containing sensor histidine kinase [Teredinibacter turnerae]|uniref:HAMP domain-containing sensor histidine kinase n=1 Tax=Teredinibacter turnerae TaxID=2426 RepID=UPI0005F7CA44|nr:sensor histidine kinase [Teredinibacter turnerae]
MLNVKRRLFWKLCITFTAGVVALFYLLDFLAVKAEDSMSQIAQKHRDQLLAWAAEAETLFNAGDNAELDRWLAQLQQSERLQAAVVQFESTLISGGQLEPERYTGFNFGRNVAWPVHLYFDFNPVMEIPFGDGQTSFLVGLPAYMRPGDLWYSTKITLQLILPMVLLAVLSLLVYSHIMRPISQLRRATNAFSHGDFSVRVRTLLGGRNDELADLADTFDYMAQRIGDQIVNQRHLIADLSHELRTPLTRLDIAVDSLNSRPSTENIARVSRESQHIRRLVEDTLTLAWLDNERPRLELEGLDLVDLIDVILEDARFEFPGRLINTALPATARIEQTCHRAVGQALENIIRNALRFTADGGAVQVTLETVGEYYRIHVQDQGPGVPEHQLAQIFQPFFRGDSARLSNHKSFGLGLALAQRQVRIVGGDIVARNAPKGGLCVTIGLPRVGHSAAMGLLGQAK